MYESTLCTQCITCHTSFSSVGIDSPIGIDSSVRINSSLGTDSSLGIDSSKGIDSWLLDSSSKCQNELQFTIPNFEELAHLYYKPTFTGPGKGVVPP